MRSSLFNVAGIPPPPRGQAPKAVTLSVADYYYPRGCAGLGQFFQPTVLYDIGPVSQIDKAFFRKLATTEVLAMDLKRLPNLGIVETPRDDNSKGKIWFSRRTGSQIDYFFHGEPQIEKEAPNWAQARGLSGEPPRRWARYQNADGRIVYRISTVGGLPDDFCTDKPTSRRGAAQYWFFDSSPNEGITRDGMPKKFCKLSATKAFNPVTPASSGIQRIAR